MRKIILLSIILFTIFNSFAQISHGGKPYSFQAEGLKSIIDYRVLPEIDLEQLYMEDAIEENDPDIPWRFGKDIAVDYSLKNSGTWDLLPNGDRIWRLEIISYSAYSINLIYNKFYMPEGGRLFLYNENKTHIIGSFTNENHKPDGGFATIPVRGERCILEYYEPAESIGQGQLEISYVIHAYKDFYANFNKGYGSSGSCNVNANCPEGDDWQEQKRGVAMILTQNNARKCSGSMINNTAEDGTPYFLTANHCKGGENTWIIMFNYESPGCDNEDGPTDQSVQYTTLRASNPISDFLLLELSEVPPLEYNVYYNGWDKIDEANQQSVCIHHPRGDIKKISFDYDPNISDKYLGTQGYADSHWKIEQWDLGTTEPGSSGSPLFNTSKQIVGQLHGGYASCTSLTSDWYGKFSTSWDFGTQASTRLMDWLDPLGTEPDELNGFDPVSNAYALNAMLVDALQPEEHYGDEIDTPPTFVIRNMGNEIIESLNISYQMDDGELSTKVWTGSIETYDTAHISFDTIHLNNGDHELFAFIDSPNGETDEYLLNDTLRKTISIDADYDIAIDEFISPKGVICTKDTLKTKFIVKNVGFQPVDAITVSVKIDDGLPQAYHFPGLIEPDAISYIVLEDVIPDELLHTITVTALIFGHSDQNPENNTIEEEFTYMGNSIALVLKTDDAAQETSWILKDDAGLLLEKGGDYDNNDIIKEGFCLGLGCYTFTMYDSKGNGIEGEGFTLTNSSTGLLLGEGSDFGDSLVIDFCVKNSLTSDFMIEKDSTCINRDVEFVNLSTGADSYSWVFEGGNPATSTEHSPIIHYENLGVFDVSLKASKGDETIETIKSDFITVLNCSGIDEIENSLFKIFPNPSNGSFTIQMNEGIIFESLRIINQLGEEVYHSLLKTNSNNKFDMDLQNGMYIVEIKYNEGFERKMLLITK